MESGTQDVDLTKSMLSTGYCLHNNDLIYLMNFVCMDLLYCNCQYTVLKQDRICFPKQGM